MRSKILAGCLWMLSIAASAQSGGRVRSGTPLRWGMNGSIEVMEGDLAQHYGRNDTATAYKRNSAPTSSAIGGNPQANRIATLQAVCDQNSVFLNWTAVQQQSSAGRYDVEQSPDGRQWSLAGTVPANRTDFGDASYSFQYSKNGMDVLFRIKAVSTSGEFAYSSVIASPCSNSSYLAVTPNPVYSTTTLRVGSPATARVRVMLVNSAGVVVQGSNANLMAGINQLPLDMSSLPKGFYTAVIQWNNGKQDVLKLVKQ